MGILNVTPDSFSDGEEYYNDVEKALKRAEEMISEGADIIDIGGESTRPGSERVTTEEELKRVIPVITAIHKKFPKIPLSIDTYKSVVAEKAIKAGAAIINSMGGFMFDSHLAEVAALFQVPLIIYHIKGTPETMQKGDIVYDNVIEEISSFLQQQIDFGVAKGMKKEQFILDPGFGFGKTVAQNSEIIKRFSEFKSFNLLLLLGVSRKSTLGAILKEKLEKEFAPTERLEAGLAATAIAVLHGAKIVRTHDVLPTKKFVSVLDSLHTSQTTIHIKELSVDCILGVSEKERSKKQTVLIDILLTIDAQRSAKTDNIHDTVNYSDVRKEIIALVEKSQFHLLEALNHAILDICLSKKGILSATVTVNKPKIYSDTKGVSMSMTKSV